MNRAAAFVLLLLATLTPAAQAPDVYSINVHVISSYRNPEAGAFVRQLDVMIEGKKYQLATGDDGYLLALGDYKARLVKDQHKTSYESHQAYEFLFPDKKTATFEVVGQRE